jgi:hypothetical protein
MKFQGAIVKEQGVTFAIIIVKKHLLDNRLEADRTIRALQPLFPGLPVVLMAQNSRGVPSYFGRPDIARFLANTTLEAIPWKEYTVS